MSHVAAFYLGGLFACVLWATYEYRTTRATIEGYVDEHGTFRIVVVGLALLIFWPASLLAMQSLPGH